MVTSALPSEGKTLTATNLALTLSESYQRRVLLIDADLRRPRMQRDVRAAAEREGLTDSLTLPRGGTSAGAPGDADAVGADRRPRRSPIR